MNRRSLLRQSSLLALATAIGGPTIGASEKTIATLRKQARADLAGPLKPPEQGEIPVAFLVAENAVVIDFGGPWEVFQDVVVSGRDESPFHLFTVAESTDALSVSGGMQIVPNYSFKDAPAAKIIVVPAQKSPSDATIEWLRSASKVADLTMSVCTGAFVLAKSGLLSGKNATTHHDFYNKLAQGFPDVKVKQGVRFVEDGQIASAGGLSSGIDLALRVVERYYGRKVAKQTAYLLEYQGQGWMYPNSNSAYLKGNT